MRLTTLSILLLASVCVYKAWHTQHVTAALTHNYDMLEDDTYEWLIVIEYAVCTFLTSALIFCVSLGSELWGTTVWKNFPTTHFRACQMVGFVLCSDCGRWASLKHQFSLCP